MNQEIVDATGTPVHDEDVERDLRHAEEEGINGERAERFYDRVRTSIQQYVEKRGRAVEKTAEFLLLVPDVFILLWRLTTDGRVTGKNKVLLGSGIAYYILPFDLIPEALLGPIGYLDDLVLAVYVLNRVLRDTDPEILREHWPGNEDVLATIQKVLDAADNLVGSQLVARIKKLVK
jgi:uncharacterized membrane protein YkvA (DUF1232 family)